METDHFSVIKFTAVKAEKRKSELKLPKVDHYAKNVTVQQSALFRLRYFTKTFHFLPA